MLMGLPSDVVGDAVLDARLLVTLALPATRSLVFGFVFIVEVIVLVVIKTAPGS